MKWIEFDDKKSPYRLSKASLRVPRGEVWRIKGKRLEKIDFSIEHASENMMQHAEKVIAQVRVSDPTALFRVFSKDGNAGNVQLFQKSFKNEFSFYILFQSDSAGGLFYIYL